MDLAKELGFSWAASVVNKVLRRYLREKEKFTTLYLTKPSLMMAHPGWLIKAVKDAWPDCWEDIILSNQCIPLKWLNVASQEQKTHLLAQFGPQISESKLVSTALSIHKNEIIKAFFDKGHNWGYMQDVAAQMLSLVIKQLPKPKKVLDACAAPGGKAFILLRDYDDIDLTCVDVDVARIEVLKQNIDRFASQKKVSIIQKDWLSNTDQEAGLFDLIVLDAPCSGSGIIKRHPEKKFNPWDLNELIPIQQKMLENIWHTLNPGGHLIYATCSILRKENALQIEAFIAGHKDVEVVDIHLPTGLKETFGWQLLPRSEMDGHYFAVLKKSS